eukprot:Nitzschia sp. Nitz4//scaffold169_size48518//31504//32691//NITZ4_007076-RA/size48518-processed-gene-0.95-mRNA-1//-1//CDS//3329538400//6960//frame0
MSQVSIGNIRKASSKTVCAGYDGVLHIRSGDAGGAAGTIFFIYVVNQLIYADKYNLLPWIHLNNVSKHVYDVAVHGSVDSIPPFHMMGGMTIDFVNDFEDRVGSGVYAGPPKRLLENQPLKPRLYKVDGTGVWSSYFEPVSIFDPSDGIPLDCQDKPLLRMHYYHLNPSMLHHCPWSVKSWPYASIGRSLAPQSDLRQWYKPMRMQGNAIVQKYIRFQPHIHEKVNKLLQPTGAESKCLALHIRHSDKGGTNRKKIPLSDFLPYAQAYVNGGGNAIVLATDSTSVLDEIKSTWPNKIQEIILRQSDDALRSSDRKAVFVLGQSNHHRTNTEVLVDILAMSKCRFFVHGFSAVSEAVMYLNFKLHSNSVDLEDHPLNHPLTPAAFEGVVKRALSKS